MTRTTAGGYFRADRKLKQLNEQKERAKNKEKNSKRLAECAQQTREKRASLAQKMTEAKTKLLNVCVLSVFDCVVF